MSDRWLRCDVRKGMFSDEVVVMIRTTSGEFASFFVPTERVSGHADHQGRVQVRAFTEDSQSWAVVPNDNQSIVPVDESEFVNA